VTHSASPSHLVEQPTNIPFKPESAVSDSFDTVMFWLLLLLVIAGVLLWILKRLQVIQGVEKLHSDIKIKESKRISQKLRAHVIEYEGNKMMVFESHVGVHALSLGDGSLDKVQVPGQNGNGQDGRNGEGRYS
jgi:flagellar biogenesis protein FliO